MYNSDNSNRIYIIFCPHLSPPWWWIWLRFMAAYFWKYFFVNWYQFYDFMTSFIYVECDPQVFTFRGSPAREIIIENCGIIDIEGLVHNSQDVDMTVKTKEEKHSSLTRHWKTKVMKNKSFALFYLVRKGWKSVWCSNLDDNILIVNEHGISYEAFNWMIQSDRYKKHKKMMNESSFFSLK